MTINKAAAGAEGKAALLEKTCEEKIGRLRGKIHPYAASASPEIVDALYTAAIDETAPAFKGMLKPSSMALTTTWFWPH